MHSHIFIRVFFPLHLARISCKISTYIYAYIRIYMHVHIFEYTCMKELFSVMSVTYWTHIHKYTYICVCIYIYIHMIFSFQCVSISVKVYSSCLTVSLVKGTSTEMDVYWRTMWDTSIAFLCESMDMVASELLAYLVCVNVYVWPRKYVDEGRKSYPLCLCERVRKPASLPYTSIIMYVSWYFSCYCSLQMHAFLVWEHMALGNWFSFVLNIHAYMHMFLHWLAWNRWDSVKLSSLSLFFGLFWPVSINLQNFQLFKYIHMQRDKEQISCRRDASTLLTCEYQPLESPVFAYIHMHSHRCHVQNCVYVHDRR